MPKAKAIPWTALLALTAGWFLVLAALFDQPRPLMLAAAALAFAAGLWNVRRGWKRRERFERMLAHRCAHCNYDLRGDPHAPRRRGARCPECGQPVRPPLRPHFAPRQ